MADKVYSKFIKEMDKAKTEHEQMTKDIHKISMPVGAAKFSSVAIWTQSYIKRVEKLKKQISNLTFIKKTLK